MLTVFVYDNDKGHLAGQHMVRQRGQTLTKILIGTCLLLTGLFVFAWVRFAAPALMAIPNNFTYAADVVSYDDFYSPETNSFTGPVLSNTKFSYKATKTEGSVTTVANTFDVRKPTGEKIFAVTREYGIDRFIGQHVPVYGDRNRTGYLFAPRGLPQQSFDYWHVNYNTPARMQFRDKETVAGIEVNRYEATFTADQTKELTSLPGVGVDKGISVDINLQLWIEPISGHLVKYEDKSIAYYYTLKTGDRLYPWNQFSNRFSFTSIAAHARQAEQERQQVLLVQVAVPTIAIVIGIFAAILLYVKRSHRSTLWQLLVGAAFVMAVGSIVFWYTVGLTVGVPELLEPMYPGAALGTAVLCGCYYIRRTRPTWVKLYGHFLGFGMLSSGSVFLAFAAYELLGIGILSFAVPVVGGSEPFILPLAALIIAILSIEEGLSIVTVKSHRFVSYMSEILACLALLLAVGSVLTYAFGTAIAGIVWLQDARFPAVLALLCVAIAIFYRQQEWLITRQLKHLGKGVWIFILVLFGTITLTGIAWQISKTSASQQAQLQFQSDINILQNAVSDRLRSYTAALYGGVGLFDASTSVERSEWKAYVDGLHLNENYPGVQGMGFAQIIPKNQVATHEKLIRSQGFPNYTIRPLTPSREIYSSIIYIEPFDERNQRAFGYDMLSEPTRREALERAWKTGAPAMTGRVTLLQETTTDVQYGFLIYVPLYKKGMPVATAEDRQKALVGFVYSPFRMNNFMQSIIGNLANGIDIEVFDSNNPGKLSSDDAMFASSKTIDATSSFRDIQTINVNGHTWSLRYTGSSDYTSDINQSTPTIVLYGGLLLSLSLAVAVFALSSSRQRALDFAQQATADLLHERNQAVQTEQKDEAILGGINEGLIVFSRDGAIERVNRAAMRMLGYTDTDLLSKKYSDILYALNEKGRPIPENKRPATLALQQGKAVATELQYARKDRSSTFIADVSIAPIRDKGRIMGAIEIFRDVTKERELDKAKDEFLSLASHQLRTPLTAKRWDLEVLMGGYAAKKLDSKQYDIASKINDSNNRMIKLVNELLNVSRAESGRLAVSPESTDMTTLIHSVVEEVMPQLTASQQKVTIDLPKLPHISVDPILIRQVFLNLLTNASKYSPASTEITVKANSTHEQLEFTVTDHGYGIPASEQSKIFTKFFRADNIRTKDTDGNGLGLYLVQSIIKVSGGKIWFKSQQGSGTTFYVSLPLKGSKKKQGEVSLT